MSKPSLPLAALCLAAAALVQPAVRAADATPAAAVKPIAPDLFADKVVVKGTGFEIKQSFLDQEVIRIKAAATAQGKTFTAEESARLELQILDQAVLVKLLNLKAGDAERAAAKAQADKKMAEGKVQLGSDEALDRQLKAAGVTRAELLEQWTEGATAEAVVKRELKIAVSDEDVKRFYNDNPARFERPELVRAAHVLLKTTDASNAELPIDQKEAKRKLAEDIIKRARAGEDFGKLARDYSEDPGSKDKGGEYTFPRGQMVAEFEAAAFALNTNQVSEIVTTRFGYHIIKVLEKTPAKKAEFAEVAAKIKEFLSQEAIKKQLPDFYKKMRAEAKVEILDSRLRAQQAADEAAALVAPVAPRSGAADKK